jgi:putative aldouronate transport system permease protein
LFSKGNSSVAREQAAFNTAVALGKRKKGASRLSTLPLHLMLLPSVIILFIYSYLPMIGVYIAFLDFDIFKGQKALWMSKFVGLDNYKNLLSMGDPMNVLLNTIQIATMKIAAGFFVPIIIAILLNEISKSYIKRTIQTVIYMPHFLSWVILAGILKQVLSSDGIVNVLISSLGMEKIPFLQSNTWFVPMLIGTNLWKEFGWGTVIYLAAITSIDPTLYEAAIVDGASRWKQTLHVTLPGMMPIIVLTMVLSMQGVLNAGFDQIFNLYSPQVYETADVIDTFVYRISFQSPTPMYDLATAVGLFKSVVSLVLISTSYWLAYKFANYQIF